MYYIHKLLCNLNKFKLSKINSYNYSKNNNSVEQKKNKPKLTFLLMTNFKVQHNELLSL